MPASCFNLKASDLLQRWKKEMTELLSNGLPSAIIFSGIFNTGDLHLK